MKKIAFVYNVDEQYWRDGLWAALNIIQTTPGWELYRFNLKETFFSDDNYDFVLVWGAFGSSQVDFVKNLPYKKGVCVAGGPIEAITAKDFDVVFVETPWHVREYQKLGIKTRLAFGTNTALFKPIPSQVKVWDAIYPAAFALWKHHYIFCQKPGKKLAVGYMQPDGWEKECYEVCLNNGVTVLPQVAPTVLVWLYNASKKVVITSDLWGGGERAVLEGLACGLPVEVEPDNEKLVELLEINRKNLATEEDYANALRAGIGGVI